MDNAKILSQSIPQEAWDENRKYIKLSTGLTMSYVEMGNPDGKVLILQHGMTDNTRSWSLAAPYFAEAGYHVFITDLRGHGKCSQPDGYYTVITYATDIKAFMDAKEIDKAIMVGHSLGSFTMQAFYLMFPEKCEAVVLEASGPLISNMKSSFKGIFDKVEAFISSDGPEGSMPQEFIDKWYANENPVPLDFIEGMKRESKALPLRVWKNVVGGITASDLEYLYPRADFSIPILIISGGKDYMLKDKGKELLSYLIGSKCEYIEFENNGHNIHFENPREFAACIINWL